MTTQENQLKEITIDYTDSELGMQKIKGYIELHQHELDGSQTILIRTKPKESVQKFLEEELTGQRY